MGSKVCQDFFEALASTQGFVSIAASADPDFVGLAYERFPSPNRGQRVYWDHLERI
jgi:predicted GNAT superfamily acetyltransferase